MRLCEEGLGVLSEEDEVLSFLTVRGGGGVTGEGGKAACTRVGKSNCMHMAKDRGGPLTPPIHLDAPWYGMVAPPDGPHPLTWMTPGMAWWPPLMAPTPSPGRPLVAPPDGPHPLTWMTLGMAWWPTLMAPTPSPV